MADRNEFVRNLLSRFAERSRWEADHANRVAVYACAIGFELGIAGPALRTLRYAATLHDIGKLEWPAELFSGDVDAGRFRSLIQSHPVEGAQRLRQTPFLSGAAEIVRTHHERMDGSGYPDGLAGAAIPLAGRILAVAEAADIRLNGAPWLSSGGGELAELQSDAFDPKVVEALHRVHRLIQPILR